MEWELELAKDRKLIQNELNGIKNDGLISPDERAKFEKAIQDAYSPWNLESISSSISKKIEPFMKRKWPLRKEVRAKITNTALKEKLERMITNATSMKELDEIETAVENGSKGGRRTRRRRTRSKRSRRHRK